MTTVPARWVGPIVTRSSVAPRSDHRDYLGHLRWDFWFACGYCHITECEAAGISFEIDHYKPESRYPQLATTYGNLMYSCRECNSGKRDHPTPEFEKLGFRFFRPDQDSPDDHFRVNPTDSRRIQGTTRLVGEYSEKMLRLNRDTLIKLREIREVFAESKAIMIRGTSVLQGLAAEKLPTQKRTLYRETRERLLKAGKRVDDKLDSTLIRELNRSELLDKDPQPRDAVERREYLRRIRASTVPPPAAPLKGATMSLRKRPKPKSGQH